MFSGIVEKTVLQQNCCFFFLVRGDLENVFSHCRVFFLPVKNRQRGCSFVLFCFCCRYFFNNVSNLETIMSDRERHTKGTRNNIILFGLSLGPFLYILISSSSRIPWQRRQLLTLPNFFKLHSVPILSRTSGAGKRNPQSKNTV